MSTSTASATENASTSTSKRTVRVALLLCDTPLPAVVTEFGDYLQIYNRWLQASLDSYPDRAVAESINLIVDGYDVVTAQEYPEWERLESEQPEGYDVVMMTGSTHDMANPFVPTLISFIRRIGTSASTSHIKLIGVCFGHQIIALAMGGECIKGTNGWEAGVYRNEIEGKEGRYWWTGSEEGEGGDDSVYIEQMHKDYVSTLPPNFTSLLHTPRYPHHSMIKLHPSSTPTSPLAQIFTVQGHPEFTPAIVNYMLDVRIPAGVFNPEEGEESRRRAGGKDGSGGEGYGRVGWAIWRVMLQDLPRK